MIQVDKVTAVVVKRYLKSAHIVATVPVGFECDGLSWYYERSMMQWLEGRFPIELTMMRTVAGKYTAAFLYRGSIKEATADDGTSVFDFE